MVIAQLRVSDTHTLPRTAAYICRRDGDYVFTLKANQPSLLDSVITKLSATNDPSHHLDIDHNRGRTEHRQIWTTNADGVDFPGAGQVFRIRRDVFNPSGQRISKQIVHGITSLTEATAHAERLAADRTRILPLLAASRP